VAAIVQEMETLGHVLEDLDDRGKGRLLMLALQIGTCLAQIGMSPQRNSSSVAVLYLADVLREESLVAGSVVGSTTIIRRGCLIPAAPKTGRNDPYPCGSGKKHKRCCGGIHSPFTVH
jgi:hypothetical protein